MIVNEALWRIHFKRELCTSLARFIQERAQVEQALFIINS